MHPNFSYRFLKQFYSKLKKSRFASFLVRLGGPHHVVPDEDGGPVERGRVAGHRRQVAEEQVGHRQPPRLQVGGGHRRVAQTPHLKEGWHKKYEA